MQHRHEDSRAEHAREAREEAAEAKAEAAATAKEEAAHKAKAVTLRAYNEKPSLVFGALASLVSQSVRVTVKGAKPGDIVHVAPTTDLGSESLSFDAIVIAPDTVAVRVHNTGTAMVKPNDCGWNVVVFQHD